MISAPEPAQNLYDDLAKWLLEQVGEDERIAREARPGPWLSGTTANHLLDTTVYAPSSWPDHIENVCNTEYSGEKATANGMHIACWDPTRVLAECLTKRQIVRTLLAQAERGHAMDAWDTLRLLAEIYAEFGRPGYREEWRP